MIDLSKFVEDWIHGYLERYRVVAVRDGGWWKVLTNVSDYQTGGQA